MNTSPSRWRIAPFLNRRLLLILSIALLVSIIPLGNFLRGVTTVQAVSPNVVISQVYGGGGATTGSPTYKNDYVELFNTSSSPAVLTGYSIQYGSSTGNFTSVYAFPAGTTIPAGKYLFVQVSSAGTAGGNFPVSPDLTTTNLNMAAGSGKVALANISSALGCGATATPCTLPHANIVDLAAYGASNNGEGGTTVNNGTAITNAQGGVRKSNGCQDTDNNNSDFDVVNNPVPRNLSTTPNICGGGGGTSLSINDVTMDEGNAGTTNFNFTVSLSAPAQTGGVSFTVNTANGTTNPATAGSDYVAIVNGAGSIPEGSSSTQVTVQVNGDTTQEPNETFFVNISGVTGASVADGQGLGTITNDDVTITPIGTIQGSGQQSPYVGQNMTTTGIVTGRKTNGYFIQDPVGDGIPGTSDALFVFTSSTPTGVAVGDSVRVSGVVAEFISASTDEPVSAAEPKTATELTSPTTIVLSSGNPLPAALTESIFNAGAASRGIELEPYEYMRVSVGSLTVSEPTNNTFGEFWGVSTGTPRPFREPGIEKGDPIPASDQGTYAGTTAPNIPVFDGNFERIMVDSDEAINASNVRRTALMVTTGAVITGIVGPLDYSFDNYRIVLDATATPNVTPGITAAIPVPTPTAQEFTVAHANLQNFGISNSNFAGRLNKASLAIRNVMHTPDVVGMIEIFDLTTLQQLAAKINGDVGNPSLVNYVAYLEEGIKPGDTGDFADDQDIGYLVNTARVSVVGTPTQYHQGMTFTYCGTTSTLHDRPSYVLNVTVPQTSGPAVPVTVILNHTKSLIASDSQLPYGSCGTGTEGARNREKRRLQSEDIADLIQSHINENLVVLGDLNAFDFNDGLGDVVGTLKGSPAPESQVVEPSVDRWTYQLTNLISTLPANERYSFSFEGNAQALDHVLVNNLMLAHNTRFAYGRYNGDFSLDYASDTNRPERLADHDAAVAYFSFAPTQPDLAISMTASRNPAPVEFNFNYNITVTNTGATATGVQVTDTLPSQVTLTATTSSQGSCTYDSLTRTVTCDLGTVNAGSPVNIQLTVKPRSEGTLNNSATVTENEVDANTNNNTASVNGLPAVKYVDLAVSMTESADPIFAGQNETYTLTVANINTPLSATGVALTDTLPASMTFVSATTSQGSLVTPPVGSTGTVTANLGTIASGATATVTITVKSTAAGSITNSATATSNESEFNAADNTASQTTTVKAAALQKVLLAKQVLIGGCENTTGNVYLTGPAGPGGVTVPLSTSSLAGVTVPASVFIPEGQTVSPAFNVTTSPVVTKQVGLVTAGSGVGSVSRGLTINVGSGTCPP